MRETSLFDDKKNWQPTSKRVLSRVVGYFLHSLNGTKLESATVVHFERFVAERNYANSTQRQCLFGVQEHLRDLGFKEHELLLYKIPKLSGKLPRCLEFEQFNALLQVCDPIKPVGARDAAIIWVLWTTGLRRFELAKACRKDLDLKSRFLEVQTKAVRGKGRHWEVKRILPRAKLALVCWMEFRKEIAAPNCKTIFCSESGQALTSDGVACIFKRKSEVVGFRVSPHDFRRGGACHMVERGVPDRFIMRQFGWRDHATFMRYTERARLKALDDLLWDGDDEDLG